MHDTYYIPVHSTSLETSRDNTFSLSLRFVCRPSTMVVWDGEHDEGAAIAAELRRQYLFRFLCFYLPFGIIIGSSILFGHLVENKNLLYFKQLNQDRNFIDQSVPFDEKEPLNIVIFYADDWTMKVLGKLNPDVHTPNIDRMADKGVLFTNNCVTTSMCWISRASFFTGVYASRHLELEPFQLEMFTTHAWNETLFPLLKNAGYYTGLVGKWHAPQPEPYISMAFDWTRFYFGDHWMERDGEMRHVTDLNREDALEFLRFRPKNKTFALKVSFFATHAWDGHNTSYVPKNESKAAWYNNVTIPTPKTATDRHWRDLPFFFEEHNEGRTRWRGRFEPDYYQDNIKDLYRMATEVDAAVGDIIAELKRQGVYKNTLLIFTTDNGNMHGEHGLAEKWYPFEESIRVPLVIQDPRMSPRVRGTTNEDWTLNIDLAPTILGAARIEPSRFMQGRDIADLYLEKGDQREKWRQDFFYEYNRGDPITAEGHEGKFWIDASFALVTKDWKYVYWPQHDYEQLFHRSHDPYDEWDLLNKSKTIQTTKEVYNSMKDRYDYLKKQVQSGKRC